MASMVHAIGALTLTCLLLLQCHLGTSSKMEQKLRAHIFKGYSNEVRPVRYYNQSLTVRMSLEVLQLLQINEDENLFEMAVWVNQLWTDYSLAWDPELWNNIGSINVDPSKVWRPDILLAAYINDGNSEHAGYMKRLKTDIILESDGSITWDARVVLKTKCQLDVHLYPNDQQKCTFKGTNLSERDAT